MSPSGPMLAHTVLFSLHDPSPQVKERLAAACKKLLSRHEGTLFFAVGTRAEDIEWSISDREFDFVLHLVFRAKADHDRYQDSPEHARFLDENGDAWKEVRVIDAYVES